jgi:isopropylmalate/homocitrate/citramalate synthase
MSFVAQAQDRYLSPINADPEVRASLHLPRRVILNDLTLREGRQVEGLVVTPDLLQRVALVLVEAGIPMLQLHSTPEHVQAIGALGLKVRTEVLTSSPTQNAPFTVAAHKERIDFILSHGLGLDLCFGTSDHLLLARQQLRGEHESVESLRERELDAALESVAYAKGQGATTGTNLQDFLRADFDFLRRFCRELASVGIDLITLDDFAAPAIPVVYRHVFQRLKEDLPDTTMGIHVTNDFGLATAVVLGALEGGAEVLDVGVNGYGERAGHADLAEVAVAVELFYGLDAGVPLEGLTGLSRRIAEMLQLPVPFTKPLVGRNAFADVTDTHYIYESHPWVFRAISAEMVGNRRRVALAGVSGVAVVQAKARELGMDLSTEQCEGALPGIRAHLASRPGGISDDEFKGIVQGG